MYVENQHENFLVLSGMCTLCSADMQYGEDGAVSVRRRSSGNDRSETTTQETGTQHARTIRTHRRRPPTQPSHASSTPGTLAC